MTHTITRRFGGVAAAVTLAAAALASPANAGPREIDYVNLGDSFSAAFGTGGVHDLGGSCYQASGPDHVSMLDSKMGVDLDLNMACAGAGAAQIAGIAATVAAPYLADAELVTLTLGGNDISWTTFLEACIGGTDAQCAGATALVGGEISTVSAKVAYALNVIREKAPGAKIVVLGYPYFFDGTSPNPLLTPAEVATSRELTAGLNSAIKAGTATVDNAVYVDVTK